MDKEKTRALFESRNQEARRLGLITLLHPAGKPPALSAVQALLEQGVNPSHADKNGIDALMLAAWSGASELVEALLPLCDPKATDKYGRTALMHAVRETRLDCARVLIGVSDVSQRAKNGKTALEMLSESGKNTWKLHRELAFLLSEHGALPEADWERVAVSAFEDLDFEQLRQALAHCDVNKLRASNIVESPLLNKAVALNLVFGVRFLLGVGADASLRDKDGMTPLMIACACSYRDCLEELSAASDLEAKNHEGQTALLLAADNGSAPAARVLLTAGADANAPNNKGETPLRVAVDAACVFKAPPEQMELVEVLAPVSDGSIRAMDGKTPLEVALAAKNFQVLDALLACLTPKEAEKEALRAVSSWMPRAGALIEAAGIEREIDGARGRGLENGESGSATPKAASRRM